MALSLLAAPFFSAQALAQEFQIYGLRALGMGGAGVAATRDSTAIYWNPAVQGFFKKDNEEMKAEYSTAGGMFSIQVGLEQTESFGDQLSMINDLDIDELKKDPEAYLLSGPGGTPNFARVTEYKEVIDVLTEFLLKNPGVRVSMASGLLTSYRNFGLGVISLGEVGATVVPDLINTGIYETNAERATQVATLSALSVPSGGFFTAGERALLVQAVVNTNPALWNSTGAGNYVDFADSSFSTVPVVNKADAMEAVVLLAQGISAQSFETNNSAAVGQGAVIGEVPVSFGWAFNDYVSVGCNLKLIYAYSYSTKFFVSDEEEDDYLEEIMDNTESAFNFGLDLGVYGRWKGLRAGLLARNLNSPTFDFADPDPEKKLMEPILKSSFRLNPQVRLGLAYLILDNLIVAADFDLTENETFFGNLPGPDHSSQLISFGLEYTPVKPISLRIGCYQNIKDDTIPVVLTGGLGLNLWAFHMDIGASMSTETDEFEGTEWPTSANVGLSFSLHF